MPKYFPGVTHCKVVTPSSSDDMKAMDNTIATVVICFGNDDDVLQPIRIKKTPGPTSGVEAKIVEANVIHNGSKIAIPTIKGKLATELIQLALVAFDKVKAQMGLKFGKSYRVFENRIEEIGVANATSS